MNSKIDILEKLIGITQLLEKPIKLAIQLQKVAFLVAKAFNVKRCAILLSLDSDGFLQDTLLSPTFTYYGNLPKIEDDPQVDLDTALAEFVTTHYYGILIENVHQSSFVAKVGHLSEGDYSLMSVPIRVDSQVIGVINVGFPLDKQELNAEDLSILTIYATYLGQSLKNNQLESIVRSKFVELAVSRELEEQGIQGYIAIQPNPAKLAKIVAKSFFKELTQSGFSANDIINIATEVLSLLNNSIEKHRQRLARDDH